MPRRLREIDHTVISYPYHELREFDAKQQLEAISSHNRYLSSLADKNDSIEALACAVPHGGDAFLREFERAVKEDGFKGATIIRACPAISRRRRRFPVLRACGRARRPVLVHPPSIGFGEERLNIYRLGSSVGRPYGRRDCDRAHDRARPVRETAETQARRHPSRRRHLRDDRPHGLCLQSAGGGISSSVPTSRC